MNITIHSLARWVDHVHLLTGVPHDSGERWTLQNATVAQDEREIIRRALMVADSGAGMISTDELAKAMCDFARAKAAELGEDVAHG